MDCSCRCCQVVQQLSTKSNVSINGPALHLHLKESSWGSNWKEFNLCKAVMHKANLQVPIHPNSSKSSKSCLSRCIGETLLLMQPLYGKGRKISAYCRYSKVDKGGSLYAPCQLLSCPPNWILFFLIQTFLASTFGFVAFRSDFDLGKLSWIAE